MRPARRGWAPSRRQAWDGAAHSAKRRTHSVSTSKSTKPTLASQWREPKKAEQGGLQASHSTYHDQKQTHSGSHLRQAASRTAKSMPQGQHSGQRSWSTAHKARVVKGWVNKSETTLAQSTLVILISGQSRSSAVVSTRHGRRVSGGVGTGAPFQALSMSHTLPRVHFVLDGGSEADSTSK